jgi:hypothetical protein
MTLSFNSRNGSASLAPQETTPDELIAAVGAAASAAGAVARARPEVRASWLNAIAQGLETRLAELPGSLAACVHGGAAHPDLAGLVGELSRRCGRVVVNGWPTGVAVGWAQQHGGPWPATTSPAHTSVGAAALSRWTRPVAFQDVPDGALPPALRDGNPWGLPRRVDGIIAS